KNRTTLLRIFSSDESFPIILEKWQKGAIKIYSSPSPLITLDQSKSQREVGPYGLCYILAGHDRPFRLTAHQALPETPAEHVQKNKPIFHAPNSSSSGKRFGEDIRFIAVVINFLGSSSPVSFRPLSASGNHAITTRTGRNGLFLEEAYGKSSLPQRGRSGATPLLLLLTKLTVLLNLPVIMVRGRDACWEHCVLVDATRQKVRCNYCQREFSGGVYRMKFHLGQIKNKDIVPCAEVPDDVRDHIQSILSTTRKQKAPKRQKVDQVANGQQNSSSISGGAHRNNGSSRQNGSTCPSLLFPHPSPIAQPAVDDILEDFSKKELVSTVLEEANAISRYIYSRAWTLNMMRKYTGGRELIHPNISRLVSNFLSLRSIVIQEASLKQIFSHSEWLSSIYSRGPDAQAFKSLLYSDRFWKSARETISVSEPLLKILRVVDGDMPAMGYIYEGMERAKIEIKAYYNGIEDKYVPLCDIIDRRWNMHLHSPLQAAAAFLNPSIFYGLNFKVDSRMKNGFQEAMLKMAVDDNVKSEITKEHPVYINAQGALGTDFAIMGRRLNAPGDWWAGYGYEIPTLQRAAIRILSQPCSSHWCKWNWSTFESLHKQKCDSLEQEKLNDLVFVQCNLWLQAIDRSREGKCKPIIFDEIDVSCEWPSESLSSSPHLDNSWLDYLSLDARG
ncbi:hypothetical protein RJ639_030883, partial [Escallonia herrerae]